MLPDLVGKWDSVARSQGGIGTTIVFDVDEAVSITLGAMLDFTYELEGSHLITTFVNPSPDSLPIDTFQISIVADTMIKRHPQTGSETTLVRVEGDSNDSIVGVWSFDHYSGRTAFEIFTDEDDYFFRVPFPSDRGHYSVDGSRLVLTMDGGVSVFDYEIDGSVLTLTPADGEPRQYRQASW